MTSHTFASARTSMVAAVAATTMLFAAAHANASAHAMTGHGNGSIACGEVIIASTTLRADLTNCPDKGIVIGADDVTLDLNGHTIDGNGLATGCPADVVCDVGVDNFAGHRGLVVKGGTIQEFNLGVLVSSDAADGRLHNLSVSRNESFGVLIDGSTDTVISHNTFTQNGICALILAHAQRARVAGNSASGGHGYAYVVASVVDSAVRDNVLDSNDHGILMVAGSSDNHVTHNTITHSRGSSIDLGEDAARNHVEHNRLIDNGDGIIGVGIHDNTISHNTVTGTGFFGFPDTGGFGIVLDGADHTTLESNTVTGGRGPAIFVTTLEAPTVSRDNRLSRNVVTSKLEDGILIDSDASGTLVERNVASRNGDDGIDVNVTAATLRGNIANGNHDLGIEAESGVTDAGNNHAAGNGNAAQCLGVLCSARNRAENRKPHRRETFAGIRAARARLWSRRQISRCNRAGPAGRFTVGSAQDPDSPSLRALENARIRRSQRGPVTNCIKSTKARRALLAAGPAYATAKTSAACVDHFTSTISPGYSFVPSSGTDTTNGETGTISCVGTIAGARVTGPGSAGFDMTYTGATCASVTGTGTLRATIPTTAGCQHLLGALTVHATALALRVDVEFPGIRYSGIGVTIPLQGDCLLKPLRRALTTDTGTLSDG